MDQPGLTVVFVHGIFSKPSNFDVLAAHVRGDESLSRVGNQTGHLSEPGPETRAYPYSTPRFCLHPARVIPNLDVIADGLWTFLGLEVPSTSNIYLVGHSQGGLAIQRMLARQLNAGRGHDLRRVIGVSLFACPNQGSAIGLTLRKTLLGQHPQERQLRPFVDSVAEAHAAVVQRVDHAREITQSSCPIPITSYVGETDGVVPVPSARGSFKNVHVLPGDHSSVLEAPTPRSPTWQALRRDIEAALSHIAIAPQAHKSAVDRPREVPGVSAPPVASSSMVIGQLPSEPQSFVRRELINRVSRELDSSHVIVVTALTGMRGVGKSHVAAACARAAVDSRVPLVAWINADSTENLLAGLVRVAERLSLVREGTDRRETVRTLTEFLSTWDQASLIVLDNAEDADLLSSVLPATGRAKVIITTTDRSFADVATSIDVDTYERSESVDYLQRRTESSDVAGANDIAAELGDLPLALAAVAGYARRYSRSFGQCLDDLAAYPVAEVLGRGKVVGYPHTTAAALLLAVDSVETTPGDVLVRTLLEIIPNLSPDGVRRDLLSQVSTALMTGAQAGPEAGLQTEWTHADVQDALERCVSASVLTWSESGESVIMHRLMARVIRERTDRAGRGDLAVDEALRLLENRGTTDGTWRRRDASLHLVQQIEALATQVFAEDRPEVPETEQSKPAVAKTRDRGTGDG